MTDQKNDQSLEALEAKLKTFETKLRTLLESTELDIKIARQLQKQLMPNKVPQIPGITCFAKFISAGELSAESFDIIPTKNGRELWFMNSWTQSYGLSSVLLQALVHLQSEALIQAHSSLDISQVFNDLSTSLTLAKKNGLYRLVVAKIDMLSLRVSGLSTGSLPFLLKSKDKNVYGPWNWVQKELFLTKRDPFLAANSSAPTLAADATAFSFILSPGSRLMCLSSQWAEHLRALDVVENKLGLEKLSEKSDVDLLSDMNAFLLNIQKAQTAAAESEIYDVVAAAFEVDSKKLHLA